MIFKDAPSDAEAAAKVANQVKLELSRARLDYVFEPPLKAVTIIKKLPISNQLTENAFTEGLLEIDSAMRATAMVAMINYKTETGLQKRVSQNESCRHGCFDEPRVGSKCHSV